MVIIHLNIEMLQNQPRKYLDYSVVFRTQLTDKKSREDDVNPFEHRNVAKPTS